MGCKHSTIKDTAAPASNSNVRKAKTPKAVVTPRAVSVAQTEAASSVKAATPKAITPKEEEVVTATPEPIFAEAIQEDAVETKKEDSIVFEEAIEEEKKADEVEAIFNCSTEAPAAVVVEDASFSPTRVHSPVQEEVQQEQPQPATPRASIAVVVEESKPDSISKAVDSAAASSKTAKKTPKTNAAVSFAANAKSSESKQKNSTPFVSRASKNAAGVHVGKSNKKGGNKKGGGNKANMQMELYLQQCAAFERLLTNANTFDKQMNTK